MRKNNKKKNLIIVVMFVLVLIAGGYGLIQYSDQEKDYGLEDSEASEGDEIESEYVPPDGERLRDIAGRISVVDGNFKIGVAMGSGYLDMNRAEIFKNEFNYVTPEADFKHQTIKNSKNMWDWERADRWVDFLEGDKYILRIHGPIGPQCADWVKDDNISGAELESELDDFISELGQRYNNVENFEYMDVVNETVSKGDWLGEKTGIEKWENPWVRIGYDTDKNKTPLNISQAFEVAGDNAGDLKLIYNHHEGPEEEKSWALIKETILYLRGKGLKVDGIGWQAHVNTGWEKEEENLEKLDELIKWSHQNDLEFHITEASVWLKVENPSESDYMAQGETYSSIIRILLENKENGMVAWNTWHLSDDKTWKKEWLPSLFNDKYEPKPSYYSVQSTLESFIDKSIHVDLNEDEKLDGKDYGIIINDWADYYDRNKFNSRSDLNGNGKIDAPDYSLFLKGWAEYFDGL